MTPRAVFSVLVLFACIALPSPSAFSQSPLQPDDRNPFDAQLQLLDFTHPTTIQGRLRLIDHSERAVWLDWELRLEQHPSGKRWRQLEGDWMLLVYPKDQAQFDALKEMRPGTRLQLVIQSNEKGQRLILSYGDPTLPPELPL
jgi:hypothetical protein